MVVSLVDENGFEISDSYIFNKDKIPLDFCMFFKPLNNFKMDFSNFDKVVFYAEKLSAKFDFVRVDFMQSVGEIYFLEFTFTPHSGFIKFIPEEYDKIYGEKLIINT